MQLELEQRWVSKLATLPESGMGYQCVRVLLKAGRTIEGALVFNAAILQVADTVAPFRSQDILDIEVSPKHSR
jgi:hypothetical protein